MRPRVIATCDFASKGESGKANLMGVFSSVMAPELPYVLERFFVYFQGQVEESDVSAPLSLSLKIFAPNGTEHRIGEATLNYESRPENAGDAVIVMEMLGFPFEVAGEYQLSFYFNDKSCGQTWISVRERS